MSIEQNNQGRPQDALLIPISFFVIPRITAAKRAFWLKGSRETGTGKDGRVISLRETGALVVGEDEIDTRREDNADSLDNRVNLGPGGDRVEPCGQVSSAGQESRPAVCADDIRAGDPLEQRHGCPLQRVQVP